MIELSDEASEATEVPESGRAFSDEVLRVEIKGPKFPRVDPSGLDPFREKSADFCRRRTSHVSRPQFNQKYYIFV